MPVYYATGSKWKAFLWATLAGWSEPLGALIGYVALGNNFSDAAFGVVFGLVAGIMVFLSFHEMLPQAFKYDPDNRYVTKALLLGFFVMAISLVLFAKDSR